MIGEIADIIGMSPYSCNGGFVLKAGSRRLSITVGPGSLESTRRLAAPPMGATGALKRKLERKNKQSQRRDPLTGFAYTLEIDLWEEDPPITHSKQMTALFAQLKEYEQVLKKLL